MARVIQALIIVVVTAVAARVVWSLLGPLIPSLLALLVVGSLIVKLVTGPRVKR